MKKISLAEGQRLINSGPTIIVTCGSIDKPNAITLAWSMVVSKTPPLIAISIAPERYSHKLISENKEFVINVPASSQLDVVMVCGTRSGRNYDKFSHPGLTATAAESVQTVAISECPGRLECALVNSISAGDHTIFIGEVKAAFAEEAFFSEHLLLGDSNNRTLHHLGGIYFAVATDVITP